MIFLLLIYAFIIIINVPGLIKRKEWRELTAFSILYVIAFALGLMYVLDIPIPSPMKGLQHLIVDILGIEYPQG
jgi:ABC-type Mn2+/Zn2+ transport system permease subunit